MTCDKIDIKLLLPDFAAGKLVREEDAGVRAHLDSCEDCRLELSLLRMMDEAVPDPPAVFWDELPERVYRLVQEHGQKNARHGLRDLLRGISLVPRWVGAAAAAAVILLASTWLFLHPALHESVAPSIVAEHDMTEIFTRSDSVLDHPSAALAELTPSELDAVSAWAATGLSSIARETGNTTAAVFDEDLNEELADLDAHEVDRLSALLNTLKNKEGESS